MTITKQMLKEKIQTALLKIIEDDQSPVKYRAWAIERIEIWSGVKKPRRKDNLQEAILKRLKEEKK